MREPLMERQRLAHVPIRSRVSACKAGRPAEHASARVPALLGAMCVRSFFFVNFVFFVTFVAASGRR